MCVCVCVCVKVCVSVCVRERERERDGGLTFAPSLSYTIEHNDNDDNKSLNCHVYVATEKKDDYEKNIFYIVCSTKMGKYFLVCKIEVETHKE